MATWGERGSTFETTDIPFFKLKPQISPQIQFFSSMINRDSPA